MHVLKGNLVKKRVEQKWEKTEKLIMGIPESKLRPA